MKVAIAYLTKDRVELTKQTFQKLGKGFDIFWVDGSATDEGHELIAACPLPYVRLCTDVRGGADAAIVYALTMMLADVVGVDEYDVVGLCENDVMLHDGWFERTIALFEKGAVDGLKVGAVSPRCYVDRILLQRNGYAVMHNLGAGIVLFTREAAQLILANYRTGWWAHNRSVFSQVSGVDIGRYGAFRSNDQWTTGDWCWDAVLAQWGLASLALSPSAVEMIGQSPSLEEQGLTLAVGPVEERRDDLAFEVFKYRTASIRSGAWKPATIKPVFSHQGIETRFAHQLKMQTDYPGEWRLQWCNGFGPFAYRADEAAYAVFEVFGPVTFLVSGGKRGAKVTITDISSGYEVSPDLPAGEQQIAQIPIPGEMSLREIRLICAPGAVFHGIQTSEPQPETSDKFDYHSLPPV